MSTELSQNRNCRLLLPSLCALMLLSGWPGASDAEPLRRLDQIKAALAAPKAQDMRAFAGQAPMRRGLLHHRPSAHAFPPGPPLAMPSFSTTYVRDGISFPLAAIGLDPARGLTTTIPTVIFAYRLQLADGTVFDASSDVIDGVTPVQGVLASPIFTPAPWSAGGVSLGITQWGDAVMRANFAGRMTDGYHVLLGMPTVIPITVDVPAAFGFSAFDPKSGAEAGIDADWLFNLIIQVTQSNRVPPTTLPIHLFSQVATAAFGHAISFGFHNAYAFTMSGATVAAPFIQAGYFSKALAGLVSSPQTANTGVLAHEVAEWLMDPAVSNFTVPWQEPGHPGVCTNPLVEIGDPLEVIAPGVDVGGYRFPDVALLPWFTGSQVLPSVNHQYSLFGGLTSRSSVCPNYVNFGGVTLGVTGADTTVFTGVNNQHQIVGFFTVGKALGSFILSNVDPIAGTAITFGSVLVPGSLGTFALGVNDAGNVVGVYFDNQGREHGFLLQGTAYTSIDFPGAVATEALGTNNHGDIVGDYTDSAGVVHGFALMNGRFQKVDAPFASSGLSVTGINDSRKAVGTYSQGGTTASFSGPLGHLQPFSFPQISPLDVADFPLTLQTLANGLNNSQEIVGSVSINGNPPVAFAATEGLFQPVSPTGDFDGVQTSQVSAVNDSGAVVGSFTDYNGTFGFLLLPGTNFGLPFQRIMIAAP
jgi:hypothetical protein